MHLQCCIKELVLHPFAMKIECLKKIPVSFATFFILECLDIELSGIISNVNRFLMRDWFFLMPNHNTTTMKKQLLFILCLTGFGGVFAQMAYSPANLKERFDVKQKENYKRLKSTSLNSFKLSYQSVAWQYTLMDGGFFTIGLNEGTSNSRIDDQCEITYGHPFAMTSFPYAVVDGERVMPLSLLANDHDALKSSFDTLSYQVDVDQNIQTTFLIHLNNFSGIQLEYILENNDSLPHQVGAALLFDAALGKWGDGTVLINDTVLSSKLDLEKVPDSIILYERAESPMGIGIEMKYGPLKPDRLRCNNWTNIFYNQDGIDDLFDLALLYEWNEITLNPSESIKISLTIKELTPDYDGREFVRWNLPDALSIERNMLFPLSFQSMAEIYSENGVQDLAFEIEGDPYVKKFTMDSTFSKPETGSLLYSPVNVSFYEIYDSVLAPVTINLLKNNQIVDHITRKVFIPAAPFSDEGLEVSIDTLFEEDEQLFLRFNVRQDANQQLLYQLYYNNVFFYIDDERFDNFTLEKDTRGGINEADIVFILDVTGSMSDEIASVRDNIIEFADSLNRQGIDFRLGMVTFLDEIENVYEFTNDAELFKSNVNLQYAHGGGDYPENSLEALYRGSEFQFRANAKRIFIWITDASFHEYDNVTSLVKQDVVDALISKGIQTHCIGNSVEQLYYYDQIILNTGGNFYDINGNFRDILLDVSRLGGSPDFLLSMDSGILPDQTDLFTIDVHYAGLGGMDTIHYYSGKKKSTSETTGVQINIYPMPLDENSLLSVYHEGEYHLRLRLINITGQLLYDQTINGITGQAQIVLAELLSYSNKKGVPLLLQLEIKDLHQNIIESKTIKILK